MLPPDRLSAITHRDDLEQVRTVIGVPARLTLSLRLFVTISAVMLYRIGAAIPLPVVRPQALEFINTTRYSSLWQYFGGNPSSSVSLFALGITPYVTSGLVLFLLGNLIPSLGRLQASGQGRERLRRITRLVALVVATLQAVAMTRGFVESRAMIGRTIDPGFANMTITVVSMVIGFLLLSLLAEAITRYGIGSGISVLLLTTLLSGVSARLMHFLPVLARGQLIRAGVIVVVGMLIVVVGLRSYYLLTAHSVRLNAIGLTSPAEFRPPLLQGGVMTLIFATSILGLIVQAANGLGDGIGRLLHPGGAYHAIAFIVLVAGFARLQLRITLDPVKVANDMVHAGYFLDGVAPGWATANRVAAAGNVAALSIFLLLAPLSLTLHLAGALSGGVTSLLPIASLLLIGTIGMEILQSARETLLPQQVFTPLETIATSNDPWITSPN